MQLSLGVESVEVILESEGSVRTRGYPVLACNVSAIVQLFEWTGDVSCVPSVLWRSGKRMISEMGRLSTKGGG